MTPERKAEVDRRLAEFEGWEPTALCKGYYIAPGLPIINCMHPAHTKVEQGPSSFICTRIQEVVHEGPPAPDYTADLNALARLEAKLPPHIWHLWDGMAEFVPNSLDMEESVGTGTEAEARAEAIYSHLKKQDAKSATAKL